MYFYAYFHRNYVKNDRYFTRSKVNEGKFLIKLQIQIKTLSIINPRKQLAPSSLA